jgi:hypothetical protein
MKPTMVMIGLLGVPVLDEYGEAYYLDPPETVLPIHSGHIGEEFGRDEFGVGAP